MGGWVGVGGEIGIKWRRGGEERGLGMLNQRCNLIGITSPLFNAKMAIASTRSTSLACQTSLGRGVINVREIDVRVMMYLQAHARKRIGNIHERDLTNMYT